MIFVLTIINNVNDIVGTKIIGHYSLLITRQGPRNRGGGHWETVCLGNGLHLSWQVPFLDGAPPQTFQMLPQSMLLAVQTPRLNVSSTYFCTSQTRTSLYFGHVFSTCMYARRSLNFPNSIHCKYYLNKCTINRV